MLWPLAFYFFVIVALVGLMIGLPRLLGERHRERTTIEPYESGSPIIGSARLRFDVRFYLIAVFFVIFDLEAVFVFGWAVGVRELGWTGYTAIAAFIGVLLAALVYLWRVGALDLWAVQSAGPKKWAAGRRA
jgi:NADH-quinone oxidoreductase subunit A